MKLKRSEKEKIASLDGEAVKLKCRICDITLEREKLRQEITGLNEELIQVQSVLVQEIRQLALVRGIDFNDPKTGRWNFDLVTMTFTRLD